jgi:hypothetical protein
VDRIEARNLVAAPPHPARIDPVPISPQAWRPQVGWLTVIAGIMVGWLLLLGVRAVWQPGPFGEYRFSIWQWEAETLPSTFLRLVGFSPPHDAARADESIERFYSLTTEIRLELAEPSPDLLRLAVLEQQRRTYENTVERTIEDRIATVVSAAGLERNLPLFRRVSIVWPPVDIELTQPPRLLVRSPRDRIERLGDTLLQTDISLNTVQSIEAQADDADTVSLVVPIGGMAAYPAIVHEDSTYAGTVGTAAHEWVHHYLSFYPLGQSWGRDGDANTLNETTANVAEDAIRQLYFEHYPIDFPDGMDGRGPAPLTSDGFDFNAEMHALRVQVDQLLAEGKVTEAEHLMDEKRLDFIRHGYAIRKLNQAYFAFYGTYANTSASTDPIGPKVERVMQLTGSVDGFLAVMRDVTTVDELDRAIAVLEARQG